MSLPALSLIWSIRETGNLDEVKIRPQNSGYRINEIFSGGDRC